VAHKHGELVSVCVECGLTAAAQSPAPDLLAAAKLVLGGINVFTPGYVCTIPTEQLETLRRAVAAAEAAQSQSHTLPPSTIEQAIAVLREPTLGELLTQRNGIPMLEEEGSLLPPIRLTERRDPLSADCSEEWTDFD
jgi:hypothetical protein